MDTDQVVLKGLFLSGVLIENLNPVALAN